MKWKNQTYTTLAGNNVQANKSRFKSRVQSVKYAYTLVGWFNGLFYIKYKTFAFHSKHLTDATCPFLFFETPIFLIFHSLPLLLSFSVCLVPYSLFCIHFDSCRSHFSLAALIYCHVFKVVRVLFFFTLIHVCFLYLSSLLYLPIDWFH